MTRVYSLVSVWEVLSSVGTSRFLSGSGRNDSLDGVLHDVPKLKSLDQIADRQHVLPVTYDHDLRVPNHTPVLDTDLIVRLVNIVHLLDTLI